MLLTFTDFGSNGPYLGQMKARFLSDTGENVPIIDLMVDVPQYNVKAAAYLLAGNIDFIPEGSIVLCVIDPGVGSERAALALECDGRWLLGPDNGLFQIVLENCKNVKIYKICTDSFVMSDSFHGRDLFAPVAAMIYKNDKSFLQKYQPDKLVNLGLANEVNEIIYIDDYGNLVTGLRGSNVSFNSVFQFMGEDVSYVRTFSYAEANKLFWYVNSNGFVEFALKEGNAAFSFKVKIGDEFSFLS